MKANRFLAPSLLAATLVACAPQKPDNYDTHAAPAAPAVAQATPAPAAPANPVYDTPAAYEESTTPATAPEVAGATAKPGAAKPGAATTAPTAATHGPATIHTVVAGDTLGKISRQYKVPITAIKQANRMTNDIVVLGRKMVIPPH